MNLFIVNENIPFVGTLKNYLQERFGNKLHISTFCTGESCLEKIDANTKFVVIDYFLKSNNGNGLLKAIKKMNPKTLVIKLSTNENMGTKIDSFRDGNNSVVITKTNQSWANIVPRLFHTIFKPIRKIAEEYELFKFMSILVVIFFAVSLIVLFFLKIETY